MIRKNKINIESEDWEMAERAIKQSGTVKEKLTSQEIGEETFSGKVEEWVEAVHGVSKIDKKKAVEKMLAELKKRDRKKRAVRVWWTAGGSVAAAILVFFTLTQWLQWGKETSDEEKITTVALTEIKVPTLITMEREHGVLSQEILDLKKAKEGYRVKGSGKKEEADVDTSEPIRYNRVVIPAGFTYKVRLADGSVVTMRHLIYGIRRSVSMLTVYSDSARRTTSGSTELVLVVLVQRFTMTEARSMAAVSLAVL